MLMKTRMRTIRTQTEYGWPMPLETFTGWPGDPTRSIVQIHTQVRTTRRPTRRSLAAHVPAPWNQETPDLLTGEQEPIVAFSGMATALPTILMHRQPALASGRAVNPAIRSMIGETCRTMLRNTVRLSPPSPSSTPRTKGPCRTPSRGSKETFQVNGNIIHSDVLMTTRIGIKTTCGCISGPCEADGTPRSPFPYQ